MKHDYFTAHGPALPPDPFDAELTKLLAEFCQKNGFDEAYCTLRNSKTREVFSWATTYHLAQ